MDTQTWFDKIFPQVLTGWKTYVAVIIWLAWSMFISPVLGLEGANDAVTFVLVAFGGTWVTYKIKRWENSQVE